MLPPDGEDPIFTVSASVWAPSQALYGVSELAELQFRVRNVRREIAERRALEKAEDRAEAAAKRKAVSWCGVQIDAFPSCWRRDSAVKKTQKEWNEQRRPFCTARCGMPWETGQSSHVNHC